MTQCGTSMAWASLAIEQLARDDLRFEGLARTYVAHPHGITAAWLERLFRF